MFVQGTAYSPDALVSSLKRLPKTGSGALSPSLLTLAFAQLFALLVMCLSSSLALCLLITAPLWSHTSATSGVSQRRRHSSGSLTGHRCSSW
ncbi:hypothetical protein WOLCODRAFT_139528 [Wolfiporia cocos MD-104 SS10]|uniref:Uncharacterized protein n=1 Tax=Wolfiporia cocos (strain MD-104) TaxID=742152 RepID=A0A2H3J4J4_WOLCO|nr:hypothetical protein WOLCODRAFT_139528 [Wolfiporia cocos MD-104 SS10]